MRKAARFQLLLLTLSVLLGCSTGFADTFPAVAVYEKTSKSVVLIVARREGGKGMVGAGTLIDGAGHILTCAHVVLDKDSPDPNRPISVFLKPNKVSGDIRKDLTERFEATIVAVDEKLDIALLKVEGLSIEVKRLELANPDEIKVGEEVVAIGHPEQGGMWTLTYGRIGGEIEGQTGIPGKDVYQTDTSVNRGNSGGPLLDRRGYVVGVNANVARLGAGNLPITGVNFAIKSAVVKRWLDGNGYKVAYGSQPLVVPPATLAIKDKELAPESPKEKDKAEAPNIANPPLGDDGISKEMAKIQAPKPQAEEKILTPKRPYSFEEVLAAVEREMEDMMKEMREKSRR